MKKLSIYFPTHNRLDWLKESVESILAPVGPQIDLELLILANGCTDGTDEYLLDLAEADHRVRYYTRTENLRDGYLFLSSKAEGEFTCLFSDDDIMLPGGMGAKLKMLEENPNLGLVFSPVRGMDAEGRDTGILTMGRIAPVDIPSGALRFPNMAIADYIPCPTAVFKTEVFKPWLYLLDEQTLPLADWAIWLEAAHAGVDGGYISWPTIRYRQHTRSDSTAFTQSGRYIADHLAMWKHWAGRGYRPTHEQLAEIQHFAAGIAKSCGKPILPAIKELTGYFQEETCAKA